MRYWLIAEYNMEISLIQIDHYQKGKGQIGNANFIFTGQGYC
ncbi:MAG: hypothetical protein NZ805_10560 [Armatimonadetes bacterium]|nr:hypothetical protein [Armatimonadota bacterium]MDW8026890.1 hypothetical protein [Armatimonadota bacterium]